MIGNSHNTATRAHHVKTKTPEPDQRETQETEGVCVKGLWWKKMETHFVLFFSSSEGSSVWWYTDKGLIHDKGKKVKLIVQKTPLGRRH